jgi:hypothetical protein
MMAHDKDAVRKIKIPVAVLGAKYRWARGAGLIPEA